MCDLFRGIRSIVALIYLDLNVIWLDRIGKFARNSWWVCVRSAGIGDKVNPAMTRAVF